MDNQIIATLKKRLEGIVAQGGGLNAEIQRNALKEELQFYILNFIYGHPKYGNWIMYGGSALRICHNLNRMSVDLDFEVDHEITNDFLYKLEGEIIEHLKSTYDFNPDLLSVSITNNRGLTLKFLIGNELGLDFHSNQVHVKIDLNHFKAPDNIIDRIPINRDQLSFVIKTYNMSTLMASKIAAIFLRGQRGVGKTLYEEKGRDIYDLLWYMEKKIVPDLDYLKAKDIGFSNPRQLFDAITKKILNNKKTDTNLRQDLTPLFENQTFIDDWLNNWRESYLRYFEDYRIRTVTDLSEIIVHQDFSSDVFSFFYRYNTEDGKSVRIICRISDYWIEFAEGDLPLEVSENVKKHYKLSERGGYSSHPPSQEKIMKYAELFYQKIEKYLKKVNRIIFGSSMETKLIRMTATNLNHNEQILLNKSALISCELDDLLK
ncbi:MAG: nucleotidyl transferase AbiEii/AbiGii toxin family protein [Candidatus Omnitrophica bacterium]|nr:nucleotidyl transferase AbiEii/AbiGii toxin family protein [Candidatus Omnitrophota bacterium]